MTVCVTWNINLGCLFCSYFVLFMLFFLLFSLLNEPRQKQCASKLVKCSARGPGRGTFDQITWMCFIFSDLFSRFPFFCLSFLMLLLQLCSFSFYFDFVVYFGHCHLANAHERKSINLKTFQMKIDFIVRLLTSSVVVVVIFYSRHSTFKWPTLSILWPHWDSINISYWLLADSCTQFFASIKSQQQ